MYIGRVGQVDKWGKMTIAINSNKDPWVAAPTSTISKNTILVNNILKSLWFLQRIN